MKKTCKKCNTEKPLTDFHRDPAGKYLVRSTCKVCRISVTRAYYQTNKNVILTKNREYYNLNREDINEWNRIYKVEMGLVSRSEINYRNAMRKASKKLQTPVWAEVDLIKELYKKAESLFKETGVKHHIDHIIPLNHHLVSGLHCLANLQILTAKDNLSKGNRWWPGMPDYNNLDFTLSKEDDIIPSLNTEIEK